MGSRFGITVALCLYMAAAAAGQVVRFETSMGDFDMVLNPTNNPVLQAHVDNMLQYVDENRYKASWINRADTGFVLQMGGFYSHTRRPPPTIDSVRPFAPFAPVPGEPAGENPGLSNTVGTVSLALSGLADGSTNQDSGTSSFFINLTSNTFLDPDFTVFAAIPDMTVVNQIMALTTIDRTSEPDFGVDAGNLGFAKVPVQANGFQVFIKRAFVISDTLAVAKDMAGIAPVMALSQSATASGDGSLVSPSIGGGGASSALNFATSTVPEPDSALLAAMGLMGAGRYIFRRRQRF